ncbi:MAG: hypothetical protein J5879_10130 [Clostridia bacterium]|nr:hypothetical protein [Clostridia bacterium]
MGLFDAFKKKKKEQEPAEEEERIDDLTYIAEMKHFSKDGWHQYDVLLASRGYGWEMIPDWADYIAEADLDDVSEVTVFSAGNDTQYVTESYHANGGKCAQTPEAQRENGGLSIAGISKTLHSPMKIIWYNQTRVLRFYTFTDDDLLMKKYVETFIRRTFGTGDAMKLAKDLPEQKQ